MGPIAIKYDRKEWQAPRVVQPRWERITLLVVLGYEAIGAMLGGSLLAAAPDGRYMNMPVDIMHGSFPDFLIPGLILLGLGILNAAAFVAVLRRTDADWLLAGLAMGGLLIWFIVEIAILQQLHWLHFMWGFPVVVGGLATLSLLPFSRETIQKALLSCGILSSLLYIVTNIITVILYKGYSPVSQTVSELSAIGAPTRGLWISLVTVYSLLVIAFGWGIRESGVENRSLRILGVLFIADAIIGFFWPPMHQREVLAAGGATLSDTLHIVFTMVTVPLMMLIIGFGAAAFGKRFRIYSLITLFILIVAGVLTSLDGPKISKNLPTPWIGIWERINIGVYMLWVIVLAIVLLRAENASNNQKIIT